MKKELLTFFVLIWGISLIGCVKSAFSQALVDYRRTGGFAGLDDHLSIDFAGNVVLTRMDMRYEFLIDDSEVNRVQDLFESIEFSKLNKEYLPARSGGDQFEYEVTYKGHRVRAADSTVPEDLWPVLELLNQIIENGERQ